MKKSLTDPLAAARRRARQRIDQDRRRYPRILGPLFEALADRLFEPGFKAEAVADPAICRRFRLAVGVTPRAYADRQLLDTALELVRETTLPILEGASPVRHRNHLPKSSGCSRV